MTISVVLSIGVLVIVIACVDFSAFFLSKDTEKLLYLDESETFADDTNGSTKVENEIVNESKEQEETAKKDEEGIEGASLPKENSDKADDASASSKFSAEEYFENDFAENDLEIDAAKLARELVEDVYADSER